MNNKLGSPSSQLRLNWSGVSNQGPRAENQDAFVLAKPEDPRLTRHGILLVVCDGVGGEKGGKIASATASHTAAESFYASDTGVEEALAKAVTDAHAAVKTEAAKEASLSNMASTIVMAHVQQPGGALTVAHVGDSRAYRFRDHKLTRLTSDHNWVFEQVQRGLMTEADAKVSSMRNMITRSLGSSPNNTPEVTHVTSDMQPGDRLLLCTDGLHGVISQDKIEEILGRSTPAREAADALVQAALPTTTDNVTAAVLDYGLPDAPALAAVVAVRAGAQESAHAKQPATARKAPVGIIAALAGLLAVGGVLAVLLTGRGPAPTDPTPTAGALEPTVTTASQAIVPSQPKPTATVIVVLAASPVAQATTALGVLEPTATILIPTNTFTPVPPTLTPTPTNTPTPAPTNTPVPPPPPPSGGGGGGGGNNPPPACQPGPGKKCP